MCLLFSASDNVDVLRNHNEFHRGRLNVFQVEQGPSRSPMIDYPSVVQISSYNKFSFTKVPPLLEG